MKLEISAVFIEGADLTVKKEIKIDTKKTIDDIIRDIGLKYEEYANFILNGESVDQSKYLNDEDYLVIMPIFSGG